METFEIQQQFFNHVKEILPAHLSLVDQLCDLLDLSMDSVYRRIRGEKPITLSELKLICEKYHISLDHVLQLQSDTVVFRAPSLKQKQFPFIDVLNSIHEQLKYINSFRSKEMLYLCKDMPIWQFYLFPELAAFKTFVWAKTIHNEPAFSGKLFSLDEFKFDDCVAVGKQIINEYNQIPSIELWNEESINSTLNQIKYYRDSGGFKNNKDLDTVVDSFEVTIEHLKQQAEKGVKFMPGDTDIMHKATVQLYINEIVIGSNTVLAEVDNKTVSFIPYNVFSYIITKDELFNKSVFEGFHTLKSRSTLISGTGEKDRNRFFTFMKDKINSLRK